MFNYSYALLLNIAVGLIALGLLLALAWRLASRRLHLPCPAWLGWMVERDNPITGSNRARDILAHAGVQPGMRVLDFGCGPGRLTIPAAQTVGRQGEVLALDLQPAMLRRAQARAEALGLANIRFLLAEAGAGHLERGRYDRALLSSVLGEIPDRRAALREIFEALKPGGILAVSEVFYDPHFQSRGFVTRLAAQVGFRAQQFFGNAWVFTLDLEKPP